MAITLVDQVLAGAIPPVDCFKTGATMIAAGTRYSPFYVTGFPGAAAAPSPGLAGAALTTYAGQIPWPGNPSSGNSYLSRLVASCTGAGTLYILDRLWHNSGIGITTTTAQTVTSAAWPARSRDGTVNGDGVMVGLEVSAALGNGAVANTTLTYTNQAGTGSKTGTIASFPAAAGIGTFIPFALASGDTGVRSIQSITLGTTYVSGTMHLVAYRVLAALSIAQANTGFEINAVTGGFPRLFDNTVPFPIWIPSSTTAVNLSFAMSLAQG